MLPFPMINFLLAVNNPTANQYVYAPRSSSTASTIFVVPPGVLSICGVLIGPGGRGGYASWQGVNNTLGSGGGGGGALYWFNNLSVTPGEQITLSVGGTNSSTDGSQISFDNGDYLLARGGNTGRPSSSPGSASGGSCSYSLTTHQHSSFGRYTGGQGKSNTTSLMIGGAGGGTAGYSGNGGNAGYADTSPWDDWVAPNVAYGAGAGGGMKQYYPTTKLNGHRGGGVSLYGWGNSGTTPGADASNVTGGASNALGYGGAGAWSDGTPTFPAKYGSNGGYGGIRLVWGAGVSFPYASNI